MSLNPPLNSNRHPYRKEGEYFLMKRDSIEFEIDIQGAKKYTGKGNVFLTTHRVICVNLSGKFKGFDLPLGFITNEEFKQPIFGSNYISGNCRMVEQGYYLKFRIWFIKGGIGTFVPALFNMLDSIRKDQQMNVINSVITGMFSERTYIDPNDPSVLYHQQPEIYHTTRTNLPQRSKAPANIVVSQEKINRQFPQGEIRYPSLQEINNPQGQNVNRDYKTYSSGAYNYSPYGKNSSN